MTLIRLNHIFLNLKFWVLNTIFIFICRSEVAFGVDSRYNMGIQAEIEVVAQNLYCQAGDRTPVPYGVLDRRMVIIKYQFCLILIKFFDLVINKKNLQGTCSNSNNCDTCRKSLHECLGHFGYIDLELPVFHVGYFRAIINILQTICKVNHHILQSFSNLN